MIGYFFASAIAWMLAFVANITPFVYGLLLPLYLLDESIYGKQFVGPGLVVCMISLLGTSKYSLKGRGDRFRLLLVSLSLVMLFSLIWHGLRGVGTFEFNVVYPLFFIALSIRKSNGLRGLVAGAFVGLSIVVGIGWYRFITGSGGLGPEHALGYWGVKYTESTRNSDVLAPLLLFCLCVGLSSTRRLVTYPMARLATNAVILVGILLSASTLLLSQSRGAWFSAIIFIALSFRPSPRTFAKILVVFLGLMFVVILEGRSDDMIDVANLVERARSIYDPSVDSSNDERGELLKYAAETAITYPILGAGPGQFSCCAIKFGYPKLANNLHPENLFLHVASEYGILSAFLLAALLMQAIVSGRSAGTPDTRIASNFLISSVIWLQFNSELASLLLWSLLALLVSIATRRVRQL